MKFWCPCCKHQIIPSSEGVNQDAQTSSSSDQDNGNFTSVLVDAPENSEQAQDLAEGVPEIVVDHTEDTYSLGMVKAPFVPLSQSSSGWYRPK